MRLVAATLTLAAAAACGDSVIGGPLLVSNASPLTRGLPENHDATFVTVDVPGSSQTRVLDLNERGELVGFYQMAGVTHGFLRDRDEAFVTVDAPNAVATFPHGINNRGDITGRFIERGTNRVRGFLLAGGAYSVFDAPGSIEIQPEFINERGDIAGKYLDGARVQHGFVLRDGVFQTIDVPGAASTDVQVYTNDGLAVGDIRDGVTPTIVHSFTLEDGVYTIFDVPGATLTLARAVGKHGDIAGIYVDPSGRHGFIRDGAGNFERVDYPGARSTEIYGANQRGTLSGSYVAGGVEHGFLRRTDAGLGAADATSATLGWQQTARDLVLKYRTDPLIATRGYALLSMARYAGVVDARAGGGRRAAESERGAAAGASAAVLSYLYPSEEPALRAMVAAQAEAGPGQSHPDFASGEAAGRAAADRVIARARVDGFDAAWAGHVPLGAGLWISTGAAPARPVLGSMRPFFLNSGSQFRPGPPPPFGSPEFVEARDEVRRISDTRTPEQLRVAQFWALRAGTVTTLGYWDERAAEQIVASGLDDVEASHVLAVLDAAAADAAIGCWDAKYTYWYLRPSHADPRITLPIGLPSHPSYPSGHSCISGSSAEVLGQLFPAVAEQLLAQAVEAGRSRVYAGIHYQFDATAGLALGRQVGAFAVDYDRRHGVLAALR